MVRGRPGAKRTRTVSTRLTEEEWQVWERARQASGRAEMGAWVRAVVDEVVAAAAGRPAVRRPGDVPRVPEVNADAYARLVGASNNLNQLTRYSHQREGLAEGISTAIEAVVAAAWVIRGLDREVAVTSLTPAQEAGAPVGPVPGTRTPRGGRGSGGGQPA